MKTILFTVFLVVANLTFAQKNNIKIAAIPSSVKKVLNAYLEVLRTSSDEAQAAQTLFDQGIIGGNLVNEFGTGPAKDIILYSLKKDFYSVKFYKNPIVITGVTYTKKSYDVYKDNYIEGEKYQIWIDKKDKSNGPPAPISVIRQVDGTAKVIGIGSL